MLRIFLIMALLSLSLKPLGAEKINHSNVDIICLKHDFKDCDLIHAMVYVESNYRSLKIKDSDGVYVYGPLQVKCATARGLGFKGKCIELLKVEIGLDYGVKYLLEKMKQYPDIVDAIAAYNSGTMYKCKKKCPKGEYVNQWHVNKVLSRYIFIKFNRHWSF